MNETDREIKLFFAGDVMTGRGIDQILAHPGRPELRERFIKDARSYVELAVRRHGRFETPVEPSHIWGDGLEILASEAPHASVINLETSITRSDQFWPLKYVHYRMHPDNVGCLLAAPIDVCTLANNHVMDFGRAGLLETLRTLEDAGLIFAGAGRDLEEATRAAVIELDGGSRLFVVACASPTSGVPHSWAAGRQRPGVNLLDDLSPGDADAVLEAIPDDRGDRDLVVVSIHWGSNWGYEVHDKQIDFAHRLVEGGVDIIHGHSSHHIRPLEVYRRKLVIYGCGDLVTDYEGIGGYEDWRGDLGGMYFATFSLPEKKLTDLQVVPTQMRKMKLRRAGADDARWLAQTLARISERFDTGFELRRGDVIGLR